MAAALFVRVGLVGTVGDRVRTRSLALREPQRLYVWMLVLAFLMTLGSEGLYRLAYDHAPGFDAIRGAGRIHVVSVFCLAVLSAFGAQKLLSRLGARGKMMAVVFVPALLCLEQLSVPTPTVTVPLKDQIPQVYRWLAEQDGQFSIVEYPLDRQAERLRVYYAIYHSKQLVNGRSGYYSPVYLELERRSEDLPWEDIVRDHEALGVRYLLVHREGFGERGRTAAQQLMRLQEDVLQGRLRLVEDLGGTIVYELTAREPAIARASGNGPNRLGIAWTEAAGRQPRSRTKILASASSMETSRPAGAAARRCPGISSRSIWDALRSSTSSSWTSVTVGWTTPGGIVWSSRRTDENGRRSTRPRPSTSRSPLFSVRPA